ncbi:MAG: hypothetical protein EXS00_04525 [Phycisphaerales bacterium]|nr:hypothetical protein [Phycisphaerales bacterium]
MSNSLGTYRVTRAWKLDAAPRHGLGTALRLLLAVLIGLPLLLLAILIAVVLGVAFMLFAFVSRLFGSNPFRGRADHSRTADSEVIVGEVIRRRVASVTSELPIKSLGTQSQRSIGTPLPPAE